jgi:hypothetical protein
MTGDAVDVLAAVAGVVVAYVAVSCARAWMARTADLNISIFRPWRGDPWPVGVQEDDDFRFQWAAAATTDRDPVADVPGQVSVERVGAISVRRVRD